MGLVDLELVYVCCVHWLDWFWLRFRLRVGVSMCVLGIFLLIFLVDFGPFNTFINEFGLGDVGLMDSTLMIKDRFHILGKPGCLSRTLRVFRNLPDHRPIHPSNHNQNIIKRKFPLGILLNGGNNMSNSKPTLIFDDEYLVPQGVRVHFVFQVVDECSLLDAVDHPALVFYVEAVSHYYQPLEPRQQLLLAFGGLALRDV